MIGSRKAAVLPVPVSAQPIKSCPLRITGIAFVCIGVGFEYPSDSQARNWELVNPSSEKVINSFVSVSAHFLGASCCLRLGPKVGGSEFREQNTNKIKTL
jgi:hypothetical protein